MGAFRAMTFEKTNLKSLLRRIASKMYYLSGAPSSGLTGKVTILTYHRVLSEKEINQSFLPPGIYVRQHVFEQQMKYLMKNFHILSFQELIDLWHDQSMQPDCQYCVITFDDGWQDNYVYAYPILKEYSIPATIFVPTGLIGTKQWFWPDKITYLLHHHWLNNSSSQKDKYLDQLWKDHLCLQNLQQADVRKQIAIIIDRCKQLSEDDITIIVRKTADILDIAIPEKRILLNWHEVEEMSQYNISFGSHSCNHKILTTLSGEMLWKEISDPFNVLSNLNVNHLKVFAYPNGNYTPEIARLVKRSGYRAAVSTKFGSESRSPRNWYGLKRITIHNDVSSTNELFSFHISGLAYSLFSKKQY
jgi:peptidoglycan/xylan/chitin deacetylase (PgdA/CDA1 family)